MSNPLAYGPKVSVVDKNSSLLVSVGIIDKHSSLQPKGLNIKSFDKLSPCRLKNEAKNDLTNFEQLL